MNRCTLNLGYIKCRDVVAQWLGENCEGTCTRGPAYRVALILHYSSPWGYAENNRCPSYSKPLTHMIWFLWVSTAYQPNSQRIIYSPLEGVARRLLVFPNDPWPDILTNQAATSPRCTLPLNSPWTWQFDFSALVLCKIGRWMTC